jgi:hypothetical protein
MALGFALFLSRNNGMACTEWNWDEQMKKNKCAAVMFCYDQDASKLLLIVFTSLLDALLPHFVDRNILRVPQMLRPQQTRTIRMKISW